MCDWVYLFLHCVCVYAPEWFYTLNLKQRAVWSSWNPLICRPSIIYNIFPLINLFNYALHWFKKMLTIIKKVAQCLHSNQNKGLEALSVPLHQQFLVVYLCKPLCQLLPSAYHHHQCDEVCNPDLAVWQLTRLSSVHSKKCMPRAKSSSRVWKRKKPDREMRGMGLVWKVGTCVQWRGKQLNSRTGNTKTWTNMKANCSSNSDVKRKIIKSM